MNDHHTPPFSHMFKYRKQKKCLFHPVTFKQMTGFTSNITYEGYFEKVTNNIYLLFFFL